MVQPVEFTPITPAAASAALSGQPDRAPAPASQTPAPAPPHPAAPAESDVRLTIEPTAAGLYVYRLTDRISGALLAEIPRLDVLTAAQREGYVAGSLVRLKT